MPAEEPLVLHITEALQGGIVRHLDWIVRALPLRGVRLRFALSLEREPRCAGQADAFRRRGVPVDAVPMTRAPSPLADWRSYRALQSLIRQVRPDLVHTHSSKAGVLGRRAAYALGIPAVHTPHVFAFEWQHGLLARQCFIQAERLAAHWCARLLLLSEAQRQAALEARIAPAGKMTIVPNGIDASAFPPPTAEQRQAARATLGIPDGIPVIGTAARLEPQKGVGDLLRCAARVVGRRPETVMLVAGAGALEAECRMRIRDLGLEDNVRLCGDVEHMLEFYHALDCFVLASLWEGLPYVLLEAQAAKLPVAASRTRGAETVISHDETGLLSEIGDSSALADHVLCLMENSAVASRLAEAGHDRVCREFTLGAWADTIAGLYHAVLAERG